MHLVEMFRSSIKRRPSDDDHHQRTQCAIDHKSLRRPPPTCLVGRPSLSYLSIILIILLQLDLIHVLNGQYQQLGGKTILTNPCHTQSTCGTCISGSDACGWCAADNYNESRCDYLNNLSRNGCPEHAIQNPVNSVQMRSDKELSNKNAINPHDIPIQLKPQYVTIQLRPHSSHTLKLQFRQAVDYPVDLYYLMDLSKSMEDDKENLSKLGNEISKQMQRITSNFRLGFGSFVDKVVMPYVNTVPEK